MKNSRTVTLWALILAVIFVFYGNTPAGAAEGKPCFKEFGVFSGFSSGNLKEKDDYEFVPVLWHFGFDMKKLFDKNNRIDERHMLIFQLEPFVSVVTSPDSNAEAGSNFIIKYGYFITKKACPYVEAGSGVSYMTQHTREQSTQFNFVDSAGAGISYFIKDDVALSAGYRFRHLSNCAIDSPNKGINTYMVLTGISWFFN